MSSNPTFPGSTRVPSDGPAKDTVKDAAKDALNTASDAAKQAAGKAAEYGRDAAGKATEYGREAVDKLDASREPVAQGFERTADAIRSYAPDSVSEKARSTANAIESAAGYIRSRDVRTMATDLTEAVRSNPGPSIIAAVAVGFLLGLAMRRSD